MPRVSGWRRRAVRCLVSRAREDSGPDSVREDIPGCVRGAADHCDALKSGSGPTAAEIILERTTTATARGRRPLQGIGPGPELDGDKVYSREGVKELSTASPNTTSC